MSVLIRANKRFSALTLDQRLQIIKAVNDVKGNRNKSILIENLYDIITNKLLEPAIARVWIESNCSAGRNEIRSIGDKCVKR